MSRRKTGLHTAAGQFFKYFKTCNLMRHQSRLGIARQTKFFLGHGGKSNLVRLNGRPVLSTEELSHGDAIRIGETTLKFIALCGDDFNWKMTDGEDAAHGANA